MPGLANCECGHTEVGHGAVGDRPCLIGGCHCRQLRAVVSFEEWMAFRRRMREKAALVEYAEIDPADLMPTEVSDDDMRGMP